MAEAIDLDYKAPGGSGLGPLVPFVSYLRTQ